jgi:hypothetical protein
MLTYDLPSISINKFGSANVVLKMFISKHVIEIMGMYFAVIDE